MTDDVYAQLADALGQLPNGFPRTPSNTEILLLKKIFSPEEAETAIQLSGEMELVGVIADRIGLPVKQARRKLMRMARQGLVWFDKDGGEPRFRLAPFVVGIYEAQLERMDHELAHLVENYLADGGAAGIMQPQPALTRVVPARGAVRSERILPYDDVRKIIEAAGRFRVFDCICRSQRDQLGRSCDFPLKTCLVLSSHGGLSSPDDLTREEAIAVLDRAEEIGLVHSVSNVMEGMKFVCNCCGCCCAILRCINEWGIERSVAHANYYAVIDPDECEGCGTCAERCQVHAIQELDGVSIVDLDRCIGCGLCVTGCPHDAAKLQLKPDAELVHPPTDYAAWERERFASRSTVG